MEREGVILEVRLAEPGASWLIERARRAGLSPRAYVEALIAEHVQEEGGADA